MVILVAAMAFGLPMPFAAVQILWNNLVTEGTITLNLVMEPGEGDELQRPPIARDEPIVTRAMAGRLVFLGALISVVVLGFYAWRQSLGLPFAQVQTETFTLLAVCEWFNVLNCRSGTKSAFATKLTTNKWLLGGLVLSNLLQAAVVFVPALNRVFHTVPFSLTEVVLIGSVASVVLWAEELRKLVARRLPGKSPVGGLQLQRF
jgi:Ca2+-transporting ATPase